MPDNSGGLSLHSKIPFPRLGSGTKSERTCAIIPNLCHYNAGYDSLAVIRFMSPSARSPAMSDLSIRTMRPDEISMAVNWAAAEGWNPGLADDACFAAADPEGFFIGELEGAPAATVSCVNYGASFAFLGFYIVREDLRGRRHGLRIWKRPSRTPAHA